MGWVFSNDGSGSGYTWSGNNTYNQHAAKITIPSTCAIYALTAYAAGYYAAVYTRLAIWNKGDNNGGNGAVLAQSNTFLMADGSESTMYTNSQVLPTPIILSAGDYWVGLYRAPNGSHIIRTVSGSGDSYKRTNTNSFPDIVGYTSGYTVDSNDEAYVGAFLIFTPDAPTGISASRVSDTNISVSWTNTNPTSSDKGYDNVYLERWDNVTSTWVAKSNLSGTTNSYNDTTTQANRQYKYRVRAKNIAGYSSYNTMANPINTTPATPSNIMATRSDGNVVITWTDNATNENHYELAKNESLDGGSTWEGWNYVSIPQQNAGATSYIDTDPYTYGIYAVRSITDTYGSLNSSWAYSNEVEGLSIPDSPTNGLPNSSVLDATEAKTFTWTFNTKDTSDQTKFSIHYRIVGAGSWTSLVSEELSAVSSYVVDADTFENGHNYEWQVKAWGAYSTGSNWSSTFTFTTTTRPTATITVPSVEDYESSTLTVEWDYSQDESNSQAEYIINLYDSNDILLESKNSSSIVASGGSDSETLNTRLTDSTTYTVELFIKESNGLWNTSIINVEFTTNFPVPSTPIISLSLDLTKGAVNIAIENPPPEGEETEASYNNVYRSIDGGITYELILSNVTINSTVTDYTPLISDVVYYYVDAISEADTSKSSSIGNLDCTMIGHFILNAGSGYEYYQLLYKDVNYSIKSGRDTQLNKYEGRENPVKYQGIAKNFVISINAEISHTEYDNLQSIVDYIGSQFYRDWKGRRFKCAITDIQFNKIDGYHYSFSFIITKVEEDVING